MRIFGGLACFSPSIPAAVKDIWVAHGGSIAVVLKEKQLSQWFFCNGVGDPWLARYSVRSVVVFHANWILASAASGFPLPLAKFALDERYTEMNDQKVPFLGNQGSYHAGMSREHSEINPEISHPYTLTTRLTTVQEGKKRPASESSPEYPAGTRPVKKINKRKSRFSEVFQDAGSGLGTSLSDAETSQVQTSATLAILPASEQISNVLLLSPPSISLPSSGNTRLLATGQSDIRENSENELESLPVNRADQGPPQRCETLVDKGQVRNDKHMGFSTESLCSVVGSPSQLSLKNSFGSGSAPDGCCAGHTDQCHGSSGSIGSAGDIDIWALLIQLNDPDSTTADADGKSIPAIRVSDALVALRRLNSENSSDGNEDVSLFVRGRMHRGRKFDVDKDDRRKTI